MYHCEYCHRRRPDALFVCLLTDRRYANNPSLHTTLSWIGVTSSPFCYLLCQNRDPRFIPGSQLTKAGSPHYQLEMVCGPFHPDVPDGPRARIMARVCRVGSRKLVNRIRFFAAYAHSLYGRGPQLYVRDRKLVEKYLLVSSHEPRNKRTAHGNKRKSTNKSIN
jgi:hypothetical protein